MGLFSDVDWTAFAGGAAGQLVTNINEKNDYYRDLMEKQDDYVNPTEGWNSGDIRR